MCAGPSPASKPEVDRVALREVSQEAASELGLPRFPKPVGRERRKKKNHQGALTVSLGLHFLDLIYFTNPTRQVGERTVSDGGHLPLSSCFQASVTDPSILSFTPLPLEEAASFFQLVGSQGSAQLLAYCSSPGDLRP